MFKTNKWMLFLYVFFSNLVFSKDYNLGSWNVLSLKLRDSKLSYFFETQLRSLKFYNHYHYYEFKGGIESKIYDNVKLAIAVGNYQTYSEGGNFQLPKNNNEFRVWPQLILLQPIGELNIEQRYRFEFRFTSNGYRNRVRYRLALVYRFKPYQFSVSDEIFFGNRAPYFERNRLMVAFNFPVNNFLTGQVGYAHQFDYKINDEIGRNFLQIGLLFDIFRTSPTIRDNEIEVKDN